jgi:hypothetical protein
LALPKENASWNKYKCSIFNLKKSLANGKSRLVQANLLPMFCSRQIDVKRCVLTKFMCGKKEIVVLSAVLEKSSKYCYTVRWVLNSFWPARFYLPYISVTHERQRRTMDKVVLRPLRIGLFAHISSQGRSLIMFCEFISIKVTLQFFVPGVPTDISNNGFFFKII